LSKKEARVHTKSIRETGAGIISLFQSVDDHPRDRKMKRLTGKESRSIRGNATYHETVS